jgi:putative ABC transport system substrate-binding protein
MRRREFVTLVGGAAAWPLAARAQRPSFPVIGFLHSATANAYAPMTAAFRKSLKEAGYVEGQNVAIEYRWAEGQFDRLPELAADLVRHQVSVIFAGGGLDPSLAAKAATSKIPIVFANGTDPVEAGLIVSLDHPGANITGITFLLNTLGPKEFEVLHELVPKAPLVAALINPKSSTAMSQLKDMQDTARAVDQKILIFQASTDREIDTVFTSLVEHHLDGLVIGADAFFFSRRDQFVGLATSRSIPTVYPWREAVVAGGLASYGASVTDAYRLAGVYVGRILKGEQAANLPVQQSTKTELVINLKTAKVLGVSVPNTLIGRADELIE